MQRANTSLTLTWGLISIPVKVYTAVPTDSGVRLHQIHTACGTRIENKKFCPQCQVIVEDIGSALPVGGGYVVPLQEEERAVIRARKKPSFEIKEMYAARSVDGLKYFDGFYYLGPDEKRTEMPYRYFHYVLKSKRLLALTVVVLNGKERVAFVKAQGSMLLLIVARDPEIIRSPKGIEPKPVELDPRMKEKTPELLEKLRKPFSEARLRQYFREIDQPSREMIEKITSDADRVIAPVATTADSLLEALEKSIAQGTESSQNGAGKKKVRTI